MSELAQNIITGLGGPSNIEYCTVCMTRLRFACKDVNIDRSLIENLDGVLGVVIRDNNHIDIVLSFGLVRDVFFSIRGLLGDRITPDSDLPANIKHSLSVQISPARRQSYHAQAEARRTGHTLEDLNQLLTILDTDDEEDLNIPKEKKTLGNLLVINGPCLNMLGIREPELYGTTTYEELCEQCKVAAKKHGYKGCNCVQSNSEGVLVSTILDAYKKYDAIVINAAAYTHTSLAIQDALLTVKIPYAEVHLTDPEQREEFRRFSFLKEHAAVRIVGKGIKGYEEAIAALAEL